MLDSPVIDLAIGIFFLFAVLASLSSAVTEAVARFLGLRGTVLMRGLLSLVDGDVAAEGTQLRELFATPVLSNQGVQTEIKPTDIDKAKGLAPGNLRVKRALPSYVAAATFSSAVLDLLLPATPPARSNPPASLPAAPPSTGGVIGAVRRLLSPPATSVPASGPTMVDIVAAIEARIASSATSGTAGAGESGSIFDRQLLSLATSSLGDVERFRASIESWYDDHMDRVSGWYKRYTRWITAFVGAVIVVGLNVQVFAFAQSLYTSQALSGAVVAKAVSASECTSKDPGICINEARQQVQSLEPGLALGWGVVPACQSVTSTPAGTTTTVTLPRCSFWQAHGFADPAPTAGTARNARVALTLVLGWLLTIFALIPGSRFWFDLINKVGSLRATGPKPAPSTK